MRTQPPEHLRPIHERLATTAQRIFGDSGIAVRVEHTGSPRAYAPAVESEIAAIAAESMLNARKHAQCRTVTVGCVFEPEVMRLRLHDDGRGFDVSSEAARGIGA